MLKFFYNGIKGTDGKLQKCHYSKGGYSRLPEDTITIYGKNYDRFSAEIRAVFVVENNTETQSDYFETDHIRVLSDHPLYAQVLAAVKAQEQKRQAHAAQRAVRFAKAEG